jgi:hypothetical protein
MNSSNQRWARNFFIGSQIANPQILGLIPQSQICKFLARASPKISNLQICNDYSANRKSANFQGKSVIFGPDPHLSLIINGVLHFYLHIKLNLQ